MQRVEGLIEPWTFGQGSGLTVVDVEVIAADACGQEVLDLPVGVLGFGGDAGGSRSVWSLVPRKCLATNGVDMIIRHRLRHIVARILDR